MARRTRGWAPSAEALVALALLAPAVPLVIAVLARRVPTWVPDLDLALTELRVRDVGGADSPLIGLPGRIGTPERQGSHPGPIGFYLLAPTYRLLGSTAFALQVATVVVHLAAVVTSVVLVARRGGPRWGLAVGLALTILVTALGPNLFTEPWNPHLPVLWWPAFLIAVWLALCGDAVALPALVVAGAICAQTHVSYVGAVALLTVLAAVVCVRWPDAAATVRSRRWVAVAGVLAVVLWVPPVVDQVRHDPGNARLLADHLLDPAEATVGWADGTRLVLERLDVVHTVRAAVEDPGVLTDAVVQGAAPWRGAVLLGLLAVVSASRIVGFPWGYLLLLVWALAFLAVLAVAAAVVHGFWPGIHMAGDANPGPELVGGRLAVVVLVTAVIAVGVRGGVAAERVEATNPVVSRTVLALLPDVLDHLEPDGHYLVTWEDAVHLGGHGYGLFVELERRGVHVAVPARLGTQFGAHRTEGPRIDGQLVVVSGDALARWEARPDALKVASADVRTADERREATRTRTSLIEHLQAAGLEDLVPAVDDNLFVVAVDPRLPPHLRALALRLDALGAAAAVYLVEV